MIEPLVICSAWNEDYAPLGEYCADSILAHIKRNEDKRRGGIYFETQTIPDDYSRPASWFKVAYIKDVLQRGAQHVLWIDCDAMMLDQGDIREFLGDRPTALQISKDQSGINCGIMAWHARGGKAIEVLDRIEARYDQFKDHPHWEQAALAQIIQEDQSAGSEIWWTFMRKEYFNCYTSDINPLTRIIHFPGFSKSDKLKLMEAQTIALARNGHGGMGAL